MGAPKKWIKALLGLKKSNKSQSLEKDENSSGCTGYLWHQGKQSVDIDSGILESELNQNVVTEIEDPKDANFQSVTDSASSPSTSLQVQNAAQLQQNTVEELAAIHIQSAFRRFLARQALCTLKGLVRLQALVRGHAVRKQTAMNLRCMQALARVQVHVQASNVHVSLENQTAQEKFQHLEHKTHINEIEDGWCDSVGSAEEIQAKLLKRKDAAAKREKAMAYASAHRLQGCGQKLKPASVKPDKSSCSHDSPERWMAVPPWENCFVDVNLVDGNVQGKPSTVDSSSRSSKPVLRGFVEDATSRPNIGSRSRSTPKERITAADKQGNKRLSLPDSKRGLGAQPAKQPSRTPIKRTPSAPKPVKAKPKLNRNDV